MSPRIVQDVIPTPRKSIRDIPLPPSRARDREKNRERELDREEKREEDEAVKAVREEFEHHNHHEYRERKPKAKRYFIIFGILVVVAIIFFIVNAMAHATVSVVLSSQSSSVSGSFVTRPESTAALTNGITDSVITLTKTGSVNVTASGTQDVETKATGTIIVFNDYSTAPQKLVANTRFQTSTGLIYRINHRLPCRERRRKAP